MNRFYCLLLLLIVVVSSCKKNSSDASKSSKETVVKFNIEVKNQGVYQIIYVDENAGVVIEKWSGLTWSKTIKVANRKTTLNTSVTVIAEYGNTTGVAKITVNGQTKVIQPFTFDQSNIHAYAQYMFEPGE